MVPTQHHVFVVHGKSLLKADTGKSKNFSFFVCERSHTRVRFVFYTRGRQAVKHVFNENF